METGRIEICRCMAQDRVRLTDTLLAFVKTDTILFAFDEACQNYFSSIVLKANQILNTAFILTRGVDIAEDNLAQDEKVRCYLDSLPLQKFALLYITAVEVRSVLLAVLFAENRIDVKTVLAAAFYEEIYQQSNWGVTAEAQQRYAAIEAKLKEWKNIADEDSLFKN